MKDQTTVLVTGCNGFLGRHLVPYLAAKGHKVIAASRTLPNLEGPNIVTAEIPDLSNPFDWEPLVQQCRAIVHLAGIAHKSATEDLYERVNYQASRALANAASRYNADLIYVSSIAAQCGSFSNYELTEDDPPLPTTPYGRSKLAAEQSIRATGVSFTILRPVVIYGDGEKGNFAMLHKATRLPIPLPFGRLTAKRSVLSVHNFCSAVAFALTDRHTRGEIFTVSDPELLTFPEIITGYRARMGRRPCLVPIPERWLELFFKGIGEEAIWQRIGCPLVARPTKLLALGWKPS